MSVSARWGGVYLKAKDMPRQRNILQWSGTWSMALSALVLVLLSGCRITDHTENDGDIDPRHISFPASGYENVDLDKMPVLTMDQTRLDVGKIVQGSKVEHRFTFTNTGGSALLLTDVRGSCGCTVSKDWPREPIAPGATGGVTVTFDSEGLDGKQTKTVTIVTNGTPSSTVLTVEGEVVGVKGLEPLER